MHTAEASRTLAHLFSELVEGVTAARGGFVLNTGDRGLLASLNSLSAQEASRSSGGGASVAAHAQHLRYGLSLMNRWAVEGGNPFADARWDEAWTVSTVDAPQWAEIRDGLADEAGRWLVVLRTPRDVAGVEFTGLVATTAHLAYHLGAIRQITTQARGPKEGTF